MTSLPVILCCLITVADCVLHTQERANRLRSGWAVTYQDRPIRQCKERVVKYEEEIKQHQQRLLDKEQEEGWSLDRLVCKLSNRH